MSLNFALDAAIVTQLQRLSFLQYFLESAAVIVSAFSGMLAARSKRMDFVGTYIVAFVTAFGGGTLRDVLLNRRPLFWVQYQQYPIVVFVLSLIFVYVPWRSLPTHPWARRLLSKPLFNFIDALGLALFSLSGASLSLGYQLPYFIAALVGVITGVFGGVLRDVLLAEIPMIFRTTTALYATCSFLGCWVFFVGLLLNVHPTTASCFGFAATVLLRMLSLHYGIRLPTPCYLQEPAELPTAVKIDRSR
jgi:uncharacterized membrane protein YeiH